MRKSFKRTTLIFCAVLAAGMVQEASAAANYVPKFSMAEMPSGQGMQVPQMEDRGNVQAPDFYSADMEAVQKKLNHNQPPSSKEKPSTKPHAPSEGKPDEEPVAADIPAAIKSEEDGGQQIFPEVAMRAVVSASDVNRLVCKGDIRDVVFSKEKGLKAQSSGKNIFLKFYASQDETGNIKYATKPVEMFVVCGDHTYNVILFPKRVPSQTIRMESGTSERIQKNTSIFAGLAFEKKINTLIKAAYTEELPESFTVEKQMEEVKAFRDIRVFLTKVVRVEGEGLAVKEYTLMPGLDTEINEKTFMTKQFSLSPAAISVEHLKLKKGVKTRLFIVETVPEAEQGGGL